jgi:hypothetical protein
MPAPPQIVTQVVEAMNPLWKSNATIHIGGVAIPGNIHAINAMPFVPFCLVYKGGRNDSSTKLRSIGNTSASLRSRRSARVIAYSDAAFSTNAQGVRMCPQLKKWVGGLRDPDSSPFTLVWTHISWLSSLVRVGKAATICQECRLVKSAFWGLGSGRIRLALTTGIGDNSDLSHNASCNKKPGRRKTRQQPSRLVRRFLLNAQDVK